MPRAGRAAVKRVGRKGDFVDVTDITGRHRGVVVHILGNGPSRTQFPGPGPGELVFACNAAYRDTPADYYFAIDRGIVMEMILTKVKKPEVFGKAELMIPPSGASAWDKTHRKDKKPFTVIRVGQSINNTGLMATLAAKVMGAKEAHLWGFDGDGVKNLYAGSPCYKDILMKGEQRMARSWTAALRSQIGLPLIDIIGHEPCWVAKLFTSPNHRLEKRIQSPAQSSEAPQEPAEPAIGG